MDALVGTVPKLPRKNLKDGLDVASVGIEMALSVVVGYFLGRWFDHTFDMAPWGSVIWLFGGFGAAVKALVRAARTARRLSAKPSSASEDVQAALVGSAWAASHREPRRDREWVR